MILNILKMYYVIICYTNFIYLIISKNKYIINVIFNYIIDFIIFKKYIILKNTSY